MLDICALIHVCSWRQVVRTAMDQSEPRLQTGIVYHNKSGDLCNKYLA